MKILGISRSPRFSPNSTARDAAIFANVAAELSRRGHDVATRCEDDLTATTTGGTPYDMAFSMARDERVLQLLARAEQADGLTVVNSPTALLSGSRTTLTRRFTAAGLPVAPAVSIGTDGALPTLMPGCRYWLKRGDACAQSADDVVPVDNAGTLAAALEDFRRRGITDIQLSAHVAGDLVKFYGVEGTPFFYYYYPTADADAFSKFGLERYNGRPGGFAFSTAALKADADRAARLSGFTVYGGDCVVRADGSYLIIDFNDWPSFSRCCPAAARAIAARIETAGATAAAKTSVLFGKNTNTAVHACTNNLRHD